MADRQTQTGTQPNEQIDKLTDKRTGRGKKADKQTDKRSDRRTNREASRLGRQTSNKGVCGMRKYSLLCPDRLPDSVVRFDQSLRETSGAER